MAKMRATVFGGPNDIRVEEVERPRPGPGEALLRITLTTIWDRPAHPPGRVPGQAGARSGRFDPTPLLTHSFPLSGITEAYELFGGRKDGVLKVAVRP
jgi:threonine dehydrogenase-like Zn-dependent dehydrogenase